MPFNDPILVVYRIGAFLLLIAALTLGPGGRRRDALAPLGRASLGVYAIHVPLVYGWSTQPGLAARVGPSLGRAQAIRVAAAVLLFSLAAQCALSGLWRWSRRAAREG